MKNGDKRGNKEAVKGAAHKRDVWRLAIVCVFPACVYLRVFTVQWAAVQDWRVILYLGFTTGNVRNKSIMMMHALCWRNVGMFKEYLGLADVPEPCFGDVRVQFMMIGRYTHTRACTHLHLNVHTHKATEARPDKQIIWRRHYSLYECNNWFHYLVRISATLNEALDSVWSPKAGWSCTLGSPTTGLCLHDVFFLGWGDPYLKSQRARLRLLLLLFV